MNYVLSFAKVNVLSNNIAEIVINKNTDVSLEMVEESNALFDNIFSHQPFAILLNKVHAYTLSFEAMLCIGDHENIIAIAVVNYSPKQLESMGTVLSLRKHDNLNLKAFEGLELGWGDAKKWLYSHFPPEKLKA
jgi:hypothetical protein